MPVADKLKEAKFFLDQLRTAFSQDHFEHYLSAFLNSCSAVPDWLLYDYAAMYLGLSADDYVTPSAFALVAKALRHGDAEKFIKWWKQETGNLTGQDPGKALLDKRNTVEHRGRVAFTIRRLPKPEIPPLYASTTTSSGSFLTSAPMVSAPLVFEPTELTTPTSPPSPGDFYFKEHQGDSVIVLCERFLRALEAYTQTAQGQFR